MSIDSLYSWNFLNKIGIPFLSIFLYNTLGSFPNNKKGAVFMRINIGENLKRLRLKKEITQEEMAEVFGVSPQAISRWENNTAYPDITLLAGIAIYYNTSIDEIIGMDEIRKAENLNNIFRDVNILVADNKVDDAIALIREGLKLHPDNGGLLLALGETLAHNNEDIAVIEEASSLLERALQRGDISMKAKSTATVNLIFLYLKLNRVEKANILIKSLPHIWESREILMPEGYDGDEYADELKKSIIKALVFLCSKVKNVQFHQSTKIPSYFQLGVDFEPKESTDEMLDLLSNFLK